MHPLAAELVLVRDLSQAQSIAAKLRNFIVAIILRRGSRLQRTPVPLGDRRENADPLLRQVIVLFALAHIADPGPQVNGTAIEDLDMIGGYQCMPLPRDVLL